MSTRPDAADPSWRGDLPTFNLPDPRPELLEPTGDEPAYFDSERWERDQWRPLHVELGDPVGHEAGRQEGRLPAVLLASDFHTGDGSVSGDDFLATHLHRNERLGVYTGFSPAD